MQAGSRAGKVLAKLHCAADKGTPDQSPPLPPPDSRPQAFKVAARRVAALYLAPPPGYTTFAQSFALACTEPLEPGPTKRIALNITTNPMTDPQAKAGLQAFRASGTAAYIKKVASRLAGIKQTQVGSALPGSSVDSGAAVLCREEGWFRDRGEGEQLR